MAVQAPMVDNPVLLNPSIKSSDIVHKQISTCAGQDRQVAGLQE